MSDALGAFLADAKLSQFHGALVELGVAQPAHLEEADDADLEGIGMKSIEIRRLRRCMANAAAPRMMPKDGAQAPQVIPVQGQVVMPPSKVMGPIVGENGDGGGAGATHAGPDDGRGGPIPIQSLPRVDDARGLLQ